MIFYWDGMPFVKIGGEWVSKCWAMKGPTGCMMDKVVPEPWQSRVEEAYQEKIKKDAEEADGPVVKKKGLHPPKKHDAAKPSEKKTKKGKHEDGGYDSSQLKELIKKESRVPTVPRKNKKSGLLSGISLDWRNK